MKNEFESFKFNVTYNFLSTRLQRITLRIRTTPCQKRNLILSYVTHMLSLNALSGNEWHNTGFCLQFWARS